MSSTDWIQLVAFLAVVFTCAPFLGKFLARVFDGERHILSFLAPVEKGIYRLTGVNPSWDMNWKQYAAAVLVFNGFGFASLMALLMTQQWLPLNPAHIGNMSWHLALSTAASFMTNTNWQSYNGEVAASYLSQMVGLAVHNFLSAGTGMAVMLALFRGIRQAAGKRRRARRARHRPGRAGQLLGGPHEDYSVRIHPPFADSRGSPDVPGRSADLCALQAGHRSGRS